MRQPFIANNLIIPQKTTFNGYYTLPISTTNAVEDWLVLTSNASTIVQLRGGGEYNEWPYKCTLDENYKDLAWLEICAKYRQLFSYIIRNKEDDSYAGCLYIYPIEMFYSNLTKEYDVDFSFWITKKEYDKGVYRKIFKELLDWLVKDWKFTRERIYLRNKELPKDLK